MKIMSKVSNSRKNQEILFKQRLLKRRLSLGLGRSHLGEEFVFLTEKIRDLSHCYFGFGTKFEGRIRFDEWGIKI